jgi:phospholipase/carboxylesterase
MIHMSTDLDKLQNAITAIVPKLLVLLEAFEQVQRSLHPNKFAQLAEFITPFEEELKIDFETFQTLDFPEDLSHFGDMMKQGCHYALRACQGLHQHEEGFGRVMQGMRAHVRAQEYIYPLAEFLSPVNKYFVETAVRQDPATLVRLAEGMQTADPEKSGILSSNNERDKRGGFSLYIPEHLDPEKPAAVVIAMHGGTGHGADFLWAWLREARTRGFILVSPTSQQDTWSLMGEEHDLQPLLAILEFVKSQWKVDESHILLTGMSDGGSYSLLAGCHEESPFTHLAPFSGVLHPDLVMTGQIRFIANRPVYLVHGSDDWMFPVEMAHMANQQLVEFGAEVTFRVIDGLTHSFARSEIPALLHWFNPALDLPD